jgi:hypothetical protein
MAQSFTIEQLPTNSQDAIREFDDRYLALLTAEPPKTWLDEIGEFVPTKSPLIRFPVGLMTTKYVETRDGNRDRGLDDRYFELKVVEYDAGYEAKLLDLTTNTYAWRKWKDIPQRFLIGEARHRARAAAALLEGGTVTVGEDGVPFFSALHPTNGGDTLFSNYQPVAKDVLSIANITAEMTAMQGAVLDENGDKIVVEPDTIMVPTPKYMGLANMISQQFVPNAAGTATMNNPYFNGLKILHNPDLTDPDDWYLIDSKLLATGLKPIVVAKLEPGEDLSLRRFDESSDHFKSTGRIKISSHIWYGFGLAFPHAIRRIAGA